MLHPSFEISQNFKVKDSLTLKKNLEAAGKITLKMGIFKNHQTTKPARDFTSDLEDFTSAPSLSSHKGSTMLLLCLRILYRMDVQIPLSGTLLDRYVFGDPNNS